MADALSINTKDSSKDSHKSEEHKALVASYVEQGFLPEPCLTAIEPYLEADSNTFDRVLSLFLRILNIRFDVERRWAIDQSDDFDYRALLADGAKAEKIKGRFVKMSSSDEVHFFLCDRLVAVGHYEDLWELADHDAYLGSLPASILINYVKDEVQSGQANDNDRYQSIRTHLQEWINRCASQQSHLVGDVVEIIKVPGDFWSSQSAIFRECQQLIQSPLVCELISPDPLKYEHIHSEARRLLRMPLRKALKQPIDVFVAWYRVRLDHNPSSLEHDAMVRALSNGGSGKITLPQMHLLLTKSQITSQGWQYASSETCPRMPILFTLELMAGMADFVQKNGCKRVRFVYEVPILQELAQLFFEKYLPDIDIKYVAKSDLSAHDFSSDESKQGAKKSGVKNRKNRRSEKAKAKESIQDDGVVFLISPHIKDMDEKQMKRFIAAMQAAFLGGFCVVNLGSFRGELPGLVSKHFGSLTLFGGNKLKTFRLYPKTISVLDFFGPGDDNGLFDGYYACCLDFFARPTHPAVQPESLFSFDEAFSAREYDPPGVDGVSSKRVLFEYMELGVLPKASISELFLGALTATELEMMTALFLRVFNPICKQFKVVNRLAYGRCLNQKLTLEEFHSEVINALHDEGTMFFEEEHATYLSHLHPRYFSSYLSRLSTVISAESNGYESFINQWIYGRDKPELLNVPNLVALSCIPKDFWIKNPRSWAYFVSETDIWWGLHVVNQRLQDKKTSTEAWEDKYLGKEPSFESAFDLAQISAAEFKISPEFIAQFFTKRRSFLERKVLWSLFADGEYHELLTAALSPTLTELGYLEETFDELIRSIIHGKGISDGEHYSDLTVYVSALTETAEAQDGSISSKAGLFRHSGLNSVLPAPNDTTNGVDSHSANENKVAH